MLDPNSFVHCTFYFARLRPKIAPIRAVRIDGTESTPNTTKPSGKRLPGPWVNSIQENYIQAGSVFTPVNRAGLLAAQKPPSRPHHLWTGWPSHELPMSVLT